MDLNKYKEETLIVYNENLNNSELLHAVKYLRGVSKVDIHLCKTAIEEWVKEPMPSQIEVLTEKNRVLTEALKEIKRLVINKTYSATAVSILHLAKEALKE